MVSKNEVRIEELLSRGPDITDGPGIVYAFVIVGGTSRDNALMVKVGATKDWKRRMREWKNQCKGEEHVWLVGIESKYRFLTESCAHIMLENRALERPVVTCEYCGRKHMEKFVMKVKDRFASNVERELIQVIEEAKRRVNTYFGV
ncbi:hypothetical protein E1B28_009475 [Marasmius oreades]|uniref:Bacteriophage T5 Orf172 DNA-binding domain-containing protein n=1 Tax=Marasmius oreades TaxID=181124 RepID=A0A9P7RNA3_9AGAR|nr:uncharacterized protein E1B28_002254 [Marasmius oreades]XP_043006825.1 uncharacterized protein E1B28_009475 [Marasmius oreades]KAG7086290.1 hypothetical protein E1B28_002254 [Marasmius oreades]KAG7090355.1 hypothetical protein E1B28_009475 [Marasmius oreades]